MIKTIKRLLGLEKTGIDLVLSRYYPENHSKAGQKTHFGSKIIGSSAIKKHQVCMDTDLWPEWVDKISKGKAYLRLIYYTCKDGQVYTIPVARFENIGMQEVTISEAGQDFILVDGLKIPLEEFVRNEGMTIHDFFDWYGYAGGKEAVIIHFTDFRY